MLPAYPEDPGFRLLRKCGAETRRHWTRESAEPWVLGTSPRMTHRATAAWCISAALAVSMMAATPMPPAVQMEMSPRPPCCDSSFARLAVMRAPVAAKGCPNAIDEPLTLSFARSIEPSGSALPRRSLAVARDPPTPSASPAPARRTPRGSRRSRSPATSSPARSSIFDTAIVGAMSSPSPPTKSLAAACE